MSLDARPDPERDPDPISDDERLTGAERELIAALRTVAPVAPTFGATDVVRRAELERLRRSVWQWRAIAAVLLVALGAALVPRAVSPPPERVVAEPAAPAPDSRGDADGRPVEVDPAPAGLAAWRLVSDELIESAIPTGMSLPAAYPSERSAQLRYGRGVLSVNVVGGVGDPL